MTDRLLRISAAAGLGLGGVLGLVGSFAPTTVLRGLAWGIDGTALVAATALLTGYYFRKGQDVAASGFLIFAIGEAVITSTAAMDLHASVPAFGAGVGLWAAALCVVSITGVFPLIVRILGFVASIAFAITALQIFAGAQLTPTTSPLPFDAYPLFVMTLFGWIWTLVRRGEAAT
jgi:hypothetical protein